MLLFESGSDEKIVWLYVHKIQSSLAITTINYTLAALNCRLEVRNIMKVNKSSVDWKSVISSYGWLELLTHLSVCSGVCNDLPPVSVSIQVGCFHTKWFIKFFAFACLQNTLVIWTRQYSWLDSYIGYPIFYRFRRFLMQKRKITLRFKTSVSK